MILSTLDDKTKEMMNSAFWQLIFAAFCALFGAIYEIFSHEVYSFFMIYAFSIPLILGVLIPILLSRYTKIRVTGPSLQILNMAIMTLTTGCIFKGVLDIYGTTNHLLTVYPLVSALLFVLAGCRLITSML